MKVYSGANIRNVAMVGHGHAGKTTLVSAMLYTAGATPRFGRVDDGSATTDYDEEEIARKMSIAAASAAWSGVGKTKINILDTPGFNMFVHEAKMVLPVVDAAIVVVDGVAGVEVVTQRVWNYCEEYKTPRLIVVNRMDRDRANAERVMESLIYGVWTRRDSDRACRSAREESVGRHRSGADEGLHLRDGRQRQRKETEIPANLKEQAQEAHEQLVELVAEGDDKLMEKFFEAGTLGEEDLVPALHNAIREDKIFPVIFSSGLGNIGADRVMDFIVDYTPAPSEHEWVQGEPAPDGNGDAPKRHETDDEPVSLYVFKTVSDAFAGRISYFKVFSGVLKNDATLVNYSRGSQEKFAHISSMQGKTAVPVNELHAGDIGAVAKLKDTLTGDSLGDKSAPIQYPRVKLPEPAITFAIEPKSRADEDKLGPGLHRLMEEDAMLRFFRDPQTQEFLIAGTGQQHIEVVVAKLKKRYHTEVVLKLPRCRTARRSAAKAEDGNPTGSTATERPSAWLGTTIIRFRGRMSRSVECRATTATARMAAERVMRYGRARDSMGDPPNRYVSLAPSFSGATGTASYIERAQDHPSWLQDNAASSERQWFTDGRPLAAFDGHQRCRYLGIGAVVSADFDNYGRRQSAPRGL